MTILSTIETDVVTDAKAGWAIVEDTLIALEPEARAALTALINELAADVESGDTVDELVTGLLNLAESKGATFVVELGTGVLRGLLAALAVA